MAHDLHRSCGTLPCSAVAAKSGSTAEDTTYTTHTQALGCHSGGTRCRCSVGRSNIFVAPKLCCRCRCRGSCAWRMWRSAALGAVSTAIGRDASPASGIKPRMLHSSSAVLRSKIHLFGVARSHQGLHDTHIYMYIIVIFIITVVIVVISSSSSSWFSSWSSSSSSSASSSSSSSSYSSLSPDARHHSWIMFIPWEESVSYCCSFLAAVWFKLKRRVERPFALQLGRSKQLSPGT